MAGARVSLRYLVWTGAYTVDGKDNKPARRGGARPEKPKAWPHDRSVLQVSPALPSMPSATLVIPSQIGVRVRCIRNSFHPLEERLVTTIELDGLPRIASLLMRIYTKD